MKSGEAILVHAWEEVRTVDKPCIYKRYGHWVCNGRGILRHSYSFATAYARWWHAVRQTNWDSPGVR